jgi:hypothetical protein
MRLPPRRSNLALSAEAEISMLWIGSNAGEIVEDMDQRS